MMSVDNFNWCLEFSNTEIKKYLIDRLEDDEIHCACIVDDRYVGHNSIEDFECVTFDGERQEFFMNFYGNQVSLFVHNNELMFIDDNDKKHYTISDIQGNIVYEGTLTNLSHKDILNLFYQMIVLFNRSEMMCFSSKLLCEKYENYPRYIYEIKITNPTVEAGVYQFANIQIEVQH